MPATYRGKVENGVIVLEPGAALPEGAEVTVSALTEEAGSVSSGDDQRDVLLKYAGAVRSWPADMAKNHDHYIHGTPRRD